MSFEKKRMEQALASTTFTLQPGLSREDRRSYIEAAADDKEHVNERFEQIKRIKSMNLENLPDVQARLEYLKAVSLHIDHLGFNRFAKAIANDDFEVFKLMMDDDEVLATNFTRATFRYLFQHFASKAHIEGMAYLLNNHEKDLYLRSEKAGWFQWLCEKVSDSTSVLNEHATKSLNWLIFEYQLPYKYAYKRHANKVQMVKEMFETREQKKRLEAKLKTTQAVTTTKRVKI
ncbi:MAG TPA: hypothetical protein VM577_07080 [Anaerovoracaceae bacterium]|nr:hypothetical protein [Anaerovoracaceae bacterium]